jgi:carbon monoxide dehydrogenase subunit G
MLVRSALAAACVLGCGSGAYALQSDVTTASPLPPDEVWRKVGDFCGIGEWLPIITSCALSADGKVRTLTSKSGGVAVERIEERDDAKRRYSYTIIGGTLPVANYRSTLSVEPDGQGSKIRWVGVYDAKGAADAQTKKLIDTLYEAGENFLAAP